MKYLKLFENHSEYYYEIDQSQFDNLLQRPELFCFTDEEILTIHEFFKKHDMEIDISWGDVSSCMGGSFFIYDRWDLDLDIIENEIMVHNSDGSTKKINISDFVSEDDPDNLEHRSQRIENFSIEIRKNWVYIFINKVFDEWFIVDDSNSFLSDSAESGGKLYKCDRIDGLIKLFEDKL